VDALDLAGQAAEHLRHAGSIFDAQLGPNLIRANCLVELDRTTEATAVYAEDLKLAEAGVGTFFLPFHHLSVARMHFLSGAWDDALTEIDAARQAPDHLGYTLHLDGLATVIAVHRGDRGATVRLETSLHRPLPTGSMRHTFDDRSWGRSMAALAVSDEATAYAVLASAWNDCVQGKREFCGHYLLPDLVALGIAQGHAAEASQAVAGLDGYMRDRPGPAMHRSAAFADARINANAEQLLRVADDYAAAGRPLFEAEAREQAAVLLAARGDSSDACRHLNAALQRYAALDANWDAAPSKRPAAPLRNPTRNARSSATAQDRLDRADPHRAEDRGVRIRRHVQPGHRRTDLHLSAHRPIPCLEHPHQTRPDLTRRTRRTCRPPVTTIRKRFVIARSRA
jgi:hypothetical protein